MRLLIDNPNPLNVLDMRELDFCPESFQVITIQFEHLWNIHKILDSCRSWIYNNLSGRYCIFEDLKIVDNKLETVYQIGFEEASESTMFSLGCPVLHGHDIKLV
jgi:hypothetical protein